MPAPAGVSPARYESTDEHARLTPVSLRKVHVVSSRRSEDPLLRDCLRYPSRFPDVTDVRHDIGMPPRAL
jgi:hypothetical protein